MLTCPHCYSNLQLEQLTEDATARKLFGLLREQSSAPELVAYLGLFKPRKQALRWTRALSLTQQLLERFGADPRLGLAMVRTVDAFREKRQTKDWRPLTSHNYLASVLDDIPMSQVPALPGADAGRTRDRSITQDLTDTSWVDTQ